MSGHSKWATIKRKKGETDAQRGKLFTKIGREISVAVKEGGADPQSNSRLRDVIAKAKANNMPNENVQRCIKKAAGEQGGENYDEIVYEGYGPGGVAVIVEAMTDNKNRTAGDVRHLFDKYGGNLGANGCVSWMFDKKGVILVQKQASVKEDELMMMVLEVGAEDFEVDDDYYEIVTEPKSFDEVRDELDKNGVKFDSAELRMIPQNYSKLDEEAAKKMEILIEKLEELDDVQNVYHNAEFPEGWEG